MTQFVVADVLLPAADATTRRCWLWFLVFLISTILGVVFLDRFQMT
jgi:hypothetical protein